MAIVTYFFRYSMQLFWVGIEQIVTFGYCTARGEFEQCRVYVEYSICICAAVGTIQDI